MNRFPMLRAGLTLVVLMAAGSAAAQVLAKPQIFTTAQEHEIAQPACLLPPHTPTSPSPEKFGAWNTVIPAAGGAAIGEILGMQTVHTVMLPSGKILMISGSSWRNKPPMQYYPEFPRPNPGTGLFIMGEDPFANNKLAWYYQLVNNAAIYDPEKNTFYRIPHPVPVADPTRPGHFTPNDFFCTGQQHLPDGNVLFTGGTQYYSPYRTGNRSTWIFDWVKESNIDWRTVDWRQVPKAGINDPLTTPASNYPPGAGPKEYPWTFAGFLQRGRWYPSLVPLLDGRLVVFSGFVGFDVGQPEMYPFEINHLVEFFDPHKFAATDTAKAWKAIDVTTTKNSPFTMEINPNFKPTPEYDPVCKERCIHDNQYDAFKLYPENYLMSENKIYLTREGDWVSMRTCDTAFMRRTLLTYWATIGGTADNPSIAFSPGPLRKEDAASRGTGVTSYGTSLLDPNSDKIEILGGQPTSAGVLYPLNAENPTHFAGGQGSRKMETLEPPKSSLEDWHWSLEENFLGDTPQDDRTMHYALILPTRQILVINGGNYDFYGPVYYPLLLTPKFDSKNDFIGYTKLRMAQALEPRHYHNTAVLLPDARIFVSGGNTSRATVTPSAIPAAVKGQAVQPKPDLNQVDLDLYFFNDGPMGKGQKGMLTTPTEDWKAEIFTPPYLYIDGDRRAEISGIDLLSPHTNYVPRKEKNGKPYFLFHSNQTYFVNLKKDSLPQTCTGKASLVLIKLPSATHGWENGQQFFDLPFTEVSGAGLQVRTPNSKFELIPPAYYMMFYVDCRGKPSVAKMVRFDDQANEPFADPVN